mmetsp:Transcript_22536/g.26124  ORF Transcript_22536/g.26124 Transcript_22536/m.26124 type:complete len:512 (+) Transcript_22536:1-1536(+)
MKMATDKKANLKGSSPKSEHEDDRKLYNYQNNQYNANYNANANNNNQYNAEDGNANNNRYNNYNGNANYNNYNANNQDSQGEENAFLTWWWNLRNGDKNMTEDIYDMYDTDNSTVAIEGLQDLSLKYAGCSSITSWAGNDGDEDEDSSGFVSNALVQYRLCPTDTCQDDSWKGCNSQYGEYMMNLNEFLDIQKDFVDETLGMYCEYCEKCDYFRTYFNGHCAHEGDCDGYADACEGDDDDEIDYDDLFDCMEVEMSSGDRRRLNNYEYGQTYDDVEEEDTTVAYVGVHCSGWNIEVGLFSDSYCTLLIATEETVDIANLTGYDFSSEELEEMYVPQTCVTCSNEEYNMKNNWFYFNEHDNGDDDEEDGNEFCSAVYEMSAKCNTNLGEYGELLEEDGSELEGEQLVCDFINDAIQGHIDEYGFVQTHDGTNNQPWYTGGNLFNFGGQQSTTPAYAGSAQTGTVSGGQVAALTLGAIGTAGMAAAAFILTKKINLGNDATEEFLPQNDKQID